MRTAKATDQQANEVLWEGVTLVLFTMPALLWLGLRLRHQARVRRQVSAQYGLMDRSRRSRGADVWLQRLQFCFGALGALYFVSAFAMTSFPLFLRPNFTIGVFLETDLLGIKHIMHAAFFLGGVRALFTTGNRRYLDIVFAISILSILPSCGLLFLATINVYQGHKSLPTLFLSSGYTALFSSGSYIAWRCMQASRQQLPCHHSKIKSIQERAYVRNKEVLQCLGLRGFQKLLAARLFARRALKIEVLLHFVVTCVAVVRRVDNAKKIRMDLCDAIPGLVEATSVTLHWGFLLGHAIFGLDLLSEQSLGIVCWGKMLLLFVMISELFIVGEHPFLAGVEILIHAYVVFCIKKTRLFLRPASSKDEIVHTCAPGVASWKYEHATSLLRYVSHLPQASRWHFFGSLATIGATSVIICLVGEAAALPWFVKEGAGKDEELLRVFAVGVNFSLHAAAMYMLAVYRPTRDRFEFQHSRGFNIGTGLLFGALCMSQTFSLVALAWMVPILFESGDGLLQIFALNATRLCCFLCSVCAYSYLPTLLPESRYSGEPATALKHEVDPESTISLNVATEAMEVSSQVDAEEVSSRVSLDFSELWHSACDLFVHFTFIPWSDREGHLTSHYFSGSRAFDLPSRQRTIIKQADVITRLGFYINWILVMCCIRINGFWLGPTGPFRSSAVNIGCLSMSSSLCYHFCFIVVGYALRGIRSPHSPMLKLVACVEAGISCIAFSAATAAAVNTSHILSLDAFTFTFTFLFYAIFSSLYTYACFHCTNAIIRGRNFFLRSVHHSWM